MQAKTVSGMVPIVVACSVEGISIIEVSCPDYDAFTRLPTALEFEGRVHGRTGWNSDSGLACYKTSAIMARRL